MTTRPPAPDGRSLWTQNASGYVGDPATDVRLFRDRDHATARERWARVDADAASLADQDTTETTAAILAGVGIAPR